LQSEAKLSDVTSAADEGQIDAVSKSKPESSVGNEVAATASNAAAGDEESVKAEADIVALTDVATEAKDVSSTSSDKTESQASVSPSASASASASTELAAQITPEPAVRVVVAQQKQEDDDDDDDEDDDRDLDDDEEEDDDSAEKPKVNDKNAISTPEGITLQPPPPPTVSIFLWFCYL